MKYKNHEWQLTNLELSKRLKELGAKQESLWWWCRLTQEFRLLEFSKVENLNREKYSAFTVAELIIKLPEEYYICQKCLWYKDKRIEINHIDNDLDKPLDYANALAKMSIYLLEKKLI